MAVGTFTWTHQGLLNKENGSIDFLTDTIVGVLVDNAHTPSQANDDVYSDISGNECADGDYAPVVLSGKAITESGGVVKMDANQIDYGSTVTIGARYVYLARRAGGSLVAGDLILGYMDLNDGGSANVDSTNSDFKVDFHATNGIHLVDATP